MGLFKIVGIVGILMRVGMELCCCGDDFVCVGSGCLRVCLSMVLVVLGCELFRFFVGFCDKGVGLFLLVGFFGELREINEDMFFVIECFGFVVIVLEVLLEIKDKG